MRARQEGGIASLKIFLMSDMTLENQFALAKILRHDSARRTNAAAPGEEEEGKIGQLERGFNCLRKCSKVTNKSEVF